MGKQSWSFQLSHLTTSLFLRHNLSHCIWLYYTFPLNYRDIEKMMLYRGVKVTYESIREWCQKFGQQYANHLRRKRPYIADKWHLDEVVVAIKGQQYYLWRAVDSEGNVLDVLLQQHRDTKAAKRFFRKVLNAVHTQEPRVINVDKNAAYPKPIDELKEKEELSCPKLVFATQPGKSPVRKPGSK